MSLECHHYHCTSTAALRPPTVFLPCLLSTVKPWGILASLPAKLRPTNNNHNIIMAITMTMTTTKIFSQRRRRRISPLLSLLLLLLAITTISTAGVAAAADVVILDKETAWQNNINDSLPSRKEDSSDNHVNRWHSVRGLSSTTTMTNDTVRGINRLVTAREMTHTHTQTNDNIGRSLFVCSFFRTSFPSSFIEYPTTTTGSLDSDHQWQHGRQRPLPLLCLDESRVHVRGRLDRVTVRTECGSLQGCRRLLCRWSTDQCSHGQGPSGLPRVHRPFQLQIHQL